MVSTIDGGHYRLLRPRLGPVQRTLTYKEGSRVVYRPEIDQDAADCAEKMVRLNPGFARAYVMDICRTETGLKMLETNCINAARFYAAELPKLADASHTINGFNPWRRIPPLSATDPRATGSIRANHGSPKPDTSSCWPEGQRALERACYLRASRPKARHKVADFCSAPMAGFYDAIDILNVVLRTNYPMGHERGIPKGTHASRLIH